MRASRLLLLSLLAAIGCGGSGVGSVGAVLGRDPETRALTVREAPEGLAAAEAGLLPGDRVMMIDGLYVGDMAGKEVREHLRGEVGTTVSLTILRGDEVRHVTVTRGKMGDRPKRPPKEETIAP